jgi:hypothetical protein
VTFSTVQKAYDKVRNELHEVGLLDEGVYLDHIACMQDAIPTRSEELGFVFDEGVDWWRGILGYEPGVIYIPRNAPASLHVPGNTVLDTVRHEFAHAWAYLDREFIEGPWFRAAFGAGYFEEWDPPAFDPSRFVSDYACKSPREDFAETFMLYLRARRSLDRYRRKPRLYRKLRAVEKAVRLAARTRVDVTVR